MERKNIMGIALVLGIVVAISFFIVDYYNSNPSTETDLIEQSVDIPESQSDQILGRVSHTITLLKPLPDTVDKVLVYKAVPAHYTRQDIINYGIKFNMSPLDDIKGGEEGFGRASTDRRIHLYLINTGWIEYTNSNRAHTVNPLDVPENLPSDEEAVKIATRFLKDRDLLPEGAVFSGTNHGKIFKLGVNGNDTVVWEDVEVWFERELNGKTVEGTQLMLAIGGNGDPIEFFTNWRKFEPYKEMRVITPDLAFEKLAKKGVAVGMNKPEKVLIYDSYLSYRTKAGAETEEYLEPVWAFKGDVMVAGKSVMPIEQYIPALSEESVKSLSS